MSRLVTLSLVAVGSGAAPSIPGWWAGSRLSKDLGGARAARGHFHLAFRLGASRIYELLAPEVDIGPWPSRRARMVASLAVDAAVTLALTRSRRSFLAPRVLADTLDLAVWGVPAVKLDHTMAAGVPTAVDAATEVGAPGLLLPLLNWSVVAALRSRLGQSTPLSSVIWQLSGCVIALGVRGYVRQQDEAQLRRHETVMRARAHAAFLRGQNDVAVRADNIVDLLARTEPLVASMEPESTPRRSGTARALHSWKAELADETRHHGAYLAALLLRVARRRQTADLASDVVFDLAERDAAVVLSARQAAFVSAHLLSGSYQGAVSVEVRRPSSHAPGQAFALRVGDEELAVPSDPSIDVAITDLAPIVVLAGGFWCGSSALRVREHTAWWAVTPALVGAGLLALRVHRDRLQGEPWPIERVIRSMLVGQVVFAPLAAATMRRGHDDAGFQQFPQLGGFLLAAPALLGLDDPGLTDRVRVRLGLTAVAATVPGFIAARRKVRLKDLVAASVLPFTGWIASRQVAHGMRDHQSALAAHIRASASVMELEAFDSGRASVVDLVEAAVSDLDERLCALRRDQPGGRTETATSHEVRLLDEAGFRVRAARSQVDQLRMGPARPAPGDRARRAGTLGHEEDQDD